MVVGKGISFIRMFEEALLITHQLQCNHLKASKHKSYRETTVGVKDSKIPFVTTKISNILFRTLLRRKLVVNIGNIIDLS